MDIKEIKTIEEYEIALKAIDVLMEYDIRFDTLLCDVLEMLIVSVEKYEQKHFFK